MPSELKPCPNPWCVATSPPLPAKGKSGWYIQCACGVRTWRQDTEAEAIAAWHQRHEPATPAGDDALVTNGQYHPEDFDEIADLAREIRSYCEGDARVNVYNKAKSVLRRERAAAHAAGEAKGRADERADVVAWLRTEAGRIDDLNRHVDAHLFADAIERGQHKEQKP